MTLCDREGNRGFVVTLAACAHDNYLLSECDDVDDDDDDGGDVQLSKHLLSNFNDFNL